MSRTIAVNVIRANLWHVSRRETDINVTDDETTRTTPPAAPSRENYRVYYWGIALCPGTSTNVGDNLSFLPHDVVLGHTVRWFSNVSGLEERMGNLSSAMSFISSSNAR